MQAYFKIVDRFTHDSNPDEKSDSGKYLSIVDTLEWTERHDEELDTGSAKAYDFKYGEYDLHTEGDDTINTYINPFSLATIYLEDNDYQTKGFHYFVNSNVTKISRFGAVADLEMVELTRWLMGVMIDGKKVTQPINKDQRLLGDVCDELLQTERLQGNGVETITKRRFYLPDDVKKFLNKFVSPEFHWEAGTLLWECLLDIGNVVNSIPRLKLNTKNYTYEVVFDKVDEVEYHETSSGIELEDNIWVL